MIVLIYNRTESIQIKEAASQKGNNSSETNEVVLSKMKSLIEYHIKESNPSKDALVVGKAGKSSGKYRYWLNVKILFIDKLDQKEEPYICKKTFNIELEQAIIAEITNQKQRNVYTKVKR